MAYITLLNRNIHKTFEWLRDIENNTQWEYEDKARALDILRVVLHELRDNLMLNDLAHFSAQLPTVIKGILFEDWNPNHSLRKEGEFAESIKAHLPQVYVEGTDINQAIKSVFLTIDKNIDKNEFEKLRKILLKGIRLLFING
jgi:uncharacterized protein (DUF2267 family)